MAEGLENLLEQVASGRLTVDEAASQIRAQRQRPSFRRGGLGATLLVIGGTFALIALAAAAYSVVLASGAKSTQGEVVEMVGGARQAPVVEYRVDGRKFMLRSSISTSPPAYAVGDKVNVLYQPDDPDRAQIDSFVSRWLFAAIFGAIGAAFLLLGLGISVTSLLSPRPAENFT